MMSAQLAHEQLGRDLTRSTLTVAEHAEAIHHLADAITAAVAELSTDEDDDAIGVRHEMVSSHVARLAVLLLEIQGETARMAGVATARGLIQGEVLP